MIPSYARPMILLFSVGCATRVQVGPGIAANDAAPPVVAQASVAQDLDFFGVSARAHGGADYASGALGGELFLRPERKGRRGTEFIPHAIIGAHLLQVDVFEGEASLSAGSPYLSAGGARCRKFPRMGYSHCIGVAADLDYRLRRTTDNAWYIGLSAVYYYLEWREKR